VSIGLTANARLLAGPDVAFALAAVISKVVGCGLGARSGRLQSRQSVRAVQF
jgi:hypothetical protein